MGLLDNMFNMNDPQSMGLLNASSQILMGSGQTQQPFGIGQALGTGIQGYMQGNQAARLRQQQEEENRAQIQMRQAQMSQIQAKQAQAEREQQEDERLKKFYMGGATGSAPPVASAEYNGNPYSADTAASAHRAASSAGMQGYSPEKLNQVMALSRQGMSMEQAAAKVFGSSGPQEASGGSSAPQQRGSGESLYEQMMGEAQRLQANGFIPQAQAKMKEALSVRPKFATDARTVMGPDGKPMLIQMADDGTARPIQGGYGAAEKLHFGDNGQNLVGMDQYTGQVKSSLGKQQTLESIASNNVSMRNANMADARAREANQINKQGQRTQIINDPNQGPLLIDKGTGIARQAFGVDGKPIRGESVIKKEVQAQGLVGVINNAEKLLDGATGSYAGAMYDTGAQFFGKGTAGAQNIAELKVLEGSIMMNQPRMEGPQSDRDVQLYRQMAGQLGDPTVPASLKKAALQQIKEINQRYAGQQSTKPAAGGWSIRKVD